MKKKRERFQNVCNSHHFLCNTRFYAEKILPCKNITYNYALKHKFIQLCYCICLIISALKYNCRAANIFSSHSLYPFSNYLLFELQDSFTVHSLMLKFCKVYIRRDIISRKLFKSD